MLTPTNLEPHPFTALPSGQHNELSYEGTTYRVIKLEPGETIYETNRLKQKKLAEVPLKTRALIKIAKQIRKLDEAKADEKIAKRLVDLKKSKACLDHGTRWAGKFAKENAHLIVVTPEEIAAEKIKAFEALAEWELSN